MVKGAEGCYPIACIHVECGEVAFFRKPGNEIVSSDVVLLNCEHPEPGSAMKCGSCGADIGPADLRHVNLESS